MKAVFRYFSCSVLTRASRDVLYLVANFKTRICICRIHITSFFEHHSDEYYHYVWHRKANFATLEQYYLCSKNDVQ